MLRTIAIAGLAVGLFGSLPAYAQEASDLEGAPGGFHRDPPPPPLKTPPPAAKPKPAAKPAPVSPSLKPVQPASQTQQAQQTAADKAAADKAIADKARADQLRLAQQADAQKAEQARLARQAEDLAALQARLDARAAELAAEEKQLHGEQEAARAAELARLDSLGRRNAPAPPAGATPGATADNDAPPPRTLPRPAPRNDEPEAPRSLQARLDFDAAERSCASAGEDAAIARRYYSASYVGEPSVFNDEGWELRGRMRLEDRRGYTVVDTVCEVDTDGAAQRFSFLR